jgi:hypothetical protein
LGSDSQNVAGAEKMYVHMVNETGDEHVLANIYVGERGGVKFYRPRGSKKRVDVVVLVNTWAEKK